MSRKLYLVLLQKTQTKFIVCYIINADGSRDLGSGGDQEAGKGVAGA